MRMPGRRARSIMGWVLLGMVLAAWISWLRPVALGGPSTIVAVKGSSMEPGLLTGDLVLTQRADAYRVGDVVAFRVPEGQVGAGKIVIHRIRAVGPDGFVMRGDNNRRDDRWHPRPADILGRMWVKVPGARLVTGALNRPLLSASLAGLIAGLYVFGLGPPPAPRARPAPRPQPA